MTACIEQTPIITILLVFGIAGILYFVYSIADVIRLYYLAKKKGVLRQ